MLIPISPLRQLVELKVAESEMQKAVQRLMEGDESAEKDLERWDRTIQLHPDYIKRKEEEARLWEEKERPLCVAALRRQRSLTPLHIAEKSTDDLIELGLTKAAATRLRQKKALWLVRMHPNNVRKMHVADLRSKFATQGLDIVEMRAVWASLPDEFDNDGDGKKEEWKRQIRTKLTEMSIKEERGEEVVVLYPTLDKESLMKCVTMRTSLAPRWPGKDRASCGTRSAIQRTR